MKHIKKLLLYLAIGGFVFLCVGTAYANDKRTNIERPTNVDYGEPISVKTYYDIKAKAWVTEESYVWELSS
ncbi:MAG: hypothetical protein HFE44_15705 [Oscillospiraceae bacterium]|mgnify:CR=1 FL=1|nr:hypothetical protein [Oscillospiraceae bacterium]